MKIVKRVAGIILFSTGSLLGQIPADFHLEATTGGRNAFDELTSVVFEADGSWSFLRYTWDDQDADSLFGAEGIVQAAQLEAIWATVQIQGFFTLEPFVEDNSIFDGAFTRVKVVADGQIHTVEARNTPVPELIAILEEITLAMGTDITLDHGYATPVEWNDRPICDFGVPVKTMIHPGGKGGNRRMNIQDILEPPHPGSFAGDKITLTEAVRRGVISLSAIGGYYGPQVAIGVDNTSIQSSGTLRLGVYLEVHGAAQNVSEIKEGIEAVWQDVRASSGEPVELDVHVRSAAPGQTDGTEGFHQVYFDHHMDAPAVSGRGQPIQPGGATGSVTIPTATGYSAQQWGHVVGHLFGLPDPVVAYQNLGDGFWLADGETDPISELDLASVLAARRPWRSLDNHLASLRRKAALHVVVPEEGHETDLMATLSGGIRSADIDWLTDHAGLLVAVEEGDILLNKDADFQNFAVTKQEAVFAPRGSDMATALHVACIDYHEGVPEWGHRFDVAPAVTDWVAIDAAPLLVDLLEYIDREELVCYSDWQAQDAIWRLTDNHRVGEPEVDAFLEAAGIDVGNTILDFPRLSDPAADDTNHVALVPPELFVAELSPVSVLTSPGTEVVVSGSVAAPLTEGEVADFGWYLEKPPKSTAAPIAGVGDVRFTPDVRGMYEMSVALDANGAGEKPQTLGDGVRITAADDATETFERASFLDGPVGWMLTESNPWEITTNRARTGSQSAVSAPIDDTQDGFQGDSTSISVRFVTTEPDTLSFAVRVSSELNFDVLKLKVNESVVKTWSGETGWLTERIGLETGPHRVEWVYVKDEVLSDGEDRAWIDDVFFPLSASVTRSEDEIPSVQSFRLSPAYPNPFRLSTTVTYALPQSHDVRLDVYDALGRIVKSFDEGRKAAGTYSIRIETAGLSSGVYHLGIQAGEFRATRPLVVVQ